MGKGVVDRLASRVHRWIKWVEMWIHPLDGRIDIH